MPSVEQSIECNVPVTTAYNQWTQFESFPEFMEGVKAVEQLDDRRLQWTAEIAGKTAKWSAEITEQLPDERISWRATSGARNDGTVLFGSLGPDRCRISLRIDYEPRGAAENVGDALGMVRGRIEGDLRRFKQFVETRGAETGAWRGEIRGGRVRRGGPSTGSTPTA